MKKIKIMKKMTKKIIISLMIIISLIVAQTDKSFVVKAEQLVPLLFTLLGICLAAYALIYSPIYEVLKNVTTNQEEVLKSLEKLLNEFKSDMMKIFFFTVIIIIVDAVRYYDVPLIKNVLNFNLWLIQIESLKEYGINFIISLSTGLSFYALYDFMEATLNIIREGLIKILIQK